MPRDISSEDQIPDYLIEDLKQAVLTYVDTRVKNPVFQTIHSDHTVSQDILTILMIFRVTETLILDHGSNIHTQDLDALSRAEVQNIADTLTQYLAEPNNQDYSTKADSIIARFAKKHLLAYLNREIQWLAVSLLSASYISSLILIRSLYELLIGIATNATGGMSDRIESIAYFKEDERKAIKKSWNNLNAWTHPYGKWEKEVCPLFISHDPLYHPTLYQIGITELRMITDILLVISIEKFQIPPTEIHDSLRDDLPSDDSIDGEKFPFFMARLHTHKS